MSRSFAMRMGLIRPFIPADIPAICRIYNYYIQHSTATFDTRPVSEESMAERALEISEKYPYIVWESDGEILGYCYAHEWKQREAYRLTLETSVYVSPDHHSKGIGKALMQELIEECKACEFHALIACITAENESSIRLHERLGFTAVSHFKQVGNKFDRILDVIDMELIIS